MTNIVPFWGAVAGCGRVFFCFLKRDGRRVAGIRPELPGLMLG
ncbi:hypothetical protein ACFLX3_00970 [Chloroflexota bacterium]